MRRWLVLSALLVLAMLVAPTAALAGDAAATADDAIVLAAGEPTGPEPQPRNAPDNAARELAGFADRELQFTWGAAWLLAGAFGFALIAAGLFYEFRVRRPAAREAAGRR